MIDLSSHNLSFSHIHFNLIVSSNFNLYLGHVLEYHFFCSQEDKIICIFYSLNYMFSCFEVSKLFKSFLGKALAA
jgi:hypothetical protein